MAGDWIKIEKGCGHKPETLKISRMLGISRREAYGLLVEFWEWLDGNCVDGVVDGVVDADVDALMSCPGLSALLRLVKWVEFDIDPPRMRVVNFHRHNGKTAKNRALKSERQANWRAKSVDVSVDSTPSTREEKRRSKTITSHSAPVGFQEFWAAYPSTKRRIGKSKCLAIWTRDSCETKTKSIVDHVKAMATSEQWRAGFEPASTTYLAQKRWEDELPTPRLVAPLQVAL